MANFVFYIEAPKSLNIDDYKNLRKLYLPIIGTDSFAIYEYLCDLLEYKTKSLFSLEEICNHLQISDLSFKDSMHKLEAVGLINTFKKENSDTFIFSIIKPQDIESFNKNPLLKAHLIKVIGEPQYNKFYFEQKQKFSSKIDFTNVSKKYQEVFSSIFEQSVQNDDYSTMDIDIDAFLTHDENIKKLHSSHFIKYLMKRNPSYYEMQLINSLLKMGFTDNSINLLIDFSYKYNNENIVCPYILKIAEDFRSRSIIDFNDVKNEISIVEALKNKKNKPYKNKETNDVFVVKTDDSITTTKEISIDDIFSDDDIKGMF